MAASTSSSQLSSHLTPSLPPGLLGLSLLSSQPPSAQGPAMTLHTLCRLDVRCRPEPAPQLHFFLPTLLACLTSTSICPKPNSLPPRALALPTIAPPQHKATPILLLLRREAAIPFWLSSLFHTNPSFILIFQQILSTVSSKQIQNFPSSLWLALAQAPFNWGQDDSCLVPLLSPLVCRRHNSQSDMVMTYIISSHSSALKQPVAFIQMSHSQKDLLPPKPFRHYSRSLLVRFFSSWAPDVACTYSFVTCLPHQSVKSLRHDPHPVLQPQHLKELLYITCTQTLLNEWGQKVLNNQTVLLKMF